MSFPFSPGGGGGEQKVSNHIISASAVTLGGIQIKRDLLNAFTRDAATATISTLCARVCLNEGRPSFRKATN